MPKRRQYQRCAFARLHISVPCLQQQRNHKGSIIVLVTLDYCKHFWLVMCSCENSCYINFCHKIYSTKQSFVYNDCQHYKTLTHNGIGCYNYSQLICLLVQGKYNVQPMCLCLYGTVASVVTFKFLHFQRACTFSQVNEIHYKDLCKVVYVMHFDLTLVHLMQMKMLTIVINIMTLMIVVVSKKITTMLVTVTTLTYAKS